MITAVHREKLVAEITAGTHKLLADVPVNLGGTGLGPGPHEILEASLAACTIITLQMYADRHQWNLTSTDVKVTIDKEGAESHLKREITLKGELTGEQKTRLMEIADKCPVHKLMTSQISISTVQLPSNESHDTNEQ